MIVEFYCPICMDAYQHTDCVFTTECGHVFHERCLTSWLLRGSTACPDCRGYCSTSSIFKIYIKSRASEQLLEIQQQLEEKIQIIQELEDKLIEAEQEQLDFIREKEFERTLSECLEAEIHEKILEIRKLREKLERKEIQYTVQLSTLETIPDRAFPTDEGTRECSPAGEEKDSATDCNESEIITKKDQIIKDLENKLSEKSLELEKEIRNSTRLIVEKIKLQQKLIAAGNSDIKHSSLPVVGTNNLNDQLKKSLENANTTVCDAAGGAENNNGAIKKRPQKSGGVENTNNGANKQCLEESVSNLLTYAKNLRQVGVKHVFLIKNNVFIMKEDAAEKIQITSEAQVDDLFQQYLEESISDLLTYAKKLRQVGYRHVFRENDKIFVMKENAAEKIQITNYTHVEALLKQEESVSELLTYAKNLRQVGYKHVFLIKDKVFIMKEDGAEKIQITSEAQVDALFEQSLEESVCDLLAYAKKLYRAGFKHVFRRKDKIFVMKYDAGKRIEITSEAQVDALFKKTRSSTNKPQNRSSTNSMNSL